MIGNNLSITSKKFEIFSGTGGVGKTTLATSRAIDLANQGMRVLLITIDPAKRLKELMGLNDSQAGEVITLNNPFQTDQDYSIDVQLMNPQKTFERIAIGSKCPEVLDNRILEILTRPYGGLNEILALVELNMQSQSGHYDTIVLDTPPGSHFLDFLDSAQRINVFFDQSFIDIFNVVGKKLDTSSLNFGKRIFNKIVSSGVKKLLGYLNKVTGEKFVEEFIDAIVAIYKTKSSFLDALNLEKRLKNQKEANWYLVTSVEQSKVKEALELLQQTEGVMSEHSYVIINKCLEETLDSWEISSESKLSNLKETLIQKEKTIKHQLKPHFQAVLEFPEIISLSPVDHINELVLNWKKI